MLSNTAVRSPSLRGLPGRDISRIPRNRTITSVVAMMLAADRIAANVLTASPELRNALYREYLGISQEWLRSHGASEAEEAQKTLDSVEQIARRPVAMRLTNLTSARRPHTRSNEHEPDYSFPGDCLRSHRSRPQQDGRYLVSPTLPCRRGRHRALAQDGQRLAEVCRPAGGQAPRCQRAGPLPDLPDR